MMNHVHSSHPARLRGGGDFKGFPDAFHAFIQYKQEIRKKKKSFSKKDMVSFSLSSVSPLHRRTCTLLDGKTFVYRGSLCYYFCNWLT